MMKLLRDAADGLQQDVRYKPFRVFRVEERDAWRLGSVCATACKMGPNPYADLLPSRHSVASGQDSRHSNDNIIAFFVARAAAGVRGYLQRLLIRELDVSRCKGEVFLTDPTPLRFILRSLWLVAALPDAT